MLYPTHLLCSALAVSTVDVYGHFEMDPLDTIIQDCFAVMIGSGLPDMDTPSSYFGRMFPDLSSYLNYKYGHRTFFHSYQFAGILLGFLLIVSGAFYMLRYFDLYINLFPFSLKVILSVLMHDWLDTFNPQGCKLMNDEKTYVFNDNPTLAIPVGSRAERKLQTAMLIWFLISIPFRFMPISQAMFYANENPGNAYEIIKARYNQADGRIAMQGIWKGTSSAIGSKSDFTWARIVGLDSEKSSVEIKFDDQPGYYWADLDGMNQKASVTITRIKKMQWKDAPIRIKQIVKDYGDLTDEDIPNGSYITGRIMVTENQELRRLFDARLLPGEALRSVLKSKDKNSVIYDLEYFPAEVLKGSLPLYVQSASLNIIYRRI